MEHSALLPAKKPHYSHHILRFLIWVVGIAVVGYIVLSLGYIVGRWNGRTAQRIANFIPTPVGWYRGAPVWQRDVLTMSSGMRTYIATAKSSGASVSGLEGNPEVIAYNTVLRTEATKRYLLAQGIRLTSEDILQAFTAQMTQSGSPNAVAERFKQLYGWTPSQYRTYITTADMLRAKMREFIVANDVLSASQRKQADAVHKIITSKELTFNDAAKKYGEDIYAAKGGDMGFIGRDELAPEIENVAFRMKVGDVSEVVVSPFGYHILQVSEQRQADSGLEIHLWQIYIAGPDVDQMVSAELKQHRPWIWEVGLRWNSEQARVEER